MAVHSKSQCGGFLADAAKWRIVGVPQISHTALENLFLQKFVSKKSPQHSTSRCSLRGQQQEVVGVLPFFSSALCSHHRNPDLKLAKSTGSRRVAFSLGGLPWPTALAVARLTGLHRTFEHGWSKLTPRSCRRTDKTGVFHTSTSKAGHVRELTKNETTRVRSTHSHWYLHAQQNFRRE